eukprot:863673-Prorocentrum_minimum.AAC.2
MVLLTKWCNWLWLSSWLLLGSPTTPAPPSSSPPTTRQVRSTPLAPASAHALPRLFGFLRALGLPALEVEVATGVGSPSSSAISAAAMASASAAASAWAVGSTSVRC